MSPQRIICACGTTAVMLVLAVPLSSDTQRTYADDVLDRAAYYAVRYERECSAVVAEEQYTQQLKWGCRGAPGGAVGDAHPATGASAWGDSRPMSREKAPPGPTHRELISDVLMVQVPDQTWAGFRDVAVVDGRQVRDRAERLESLFLKSPATLKRIQRESARYNIGNIRPEFNLPTFALAYLHPGVRDRFTFRKTAEEPVEGTKTFLFSFNEVDQPTVIKDAVGRDVPSSGWFWVDPSSGEVLQSLLVAGDDTSEARVESRVLYRRHESWRFLLPAEMNEVYDQPARPDGPCVVGLARYSNFRRFQVTVDEKTKLPK